LQVTCDTYQLDEVVVGRAVEVTPLKTANEPAMEAHPILGAASLMEALR
jgi:hypothetical protein